MEKYPDCGWDHLLGRDPGLYDGLEQSEVSTGMHSLALFFQAKYES